VSLVMHINVPNRFRSFHEIKIIHGELGPRGGRERVNSPGASVDRTTKRE